MRESFRYLVCAGCIVFCGSHARAAPCVGPPRRRPPEVTALACASAPAQGNTAAAYGPWNRDSGTARCCGLEYQSHKLILYKNKKAYAQDSAVSAEERAGRRAV